MALRREKGLAEETARAVRPGEHILAAVSGGADSVALLLALCDLRDQGRIRLSAAHFEHGIRGEESIADMRFAEKMCAEKNVPFYAGSGDVPAESVRRGTGLEETARDLRRAFLAKTAKSIGADAIALAHHADDQAETVLMRLMRGSGGRGIGGMRERDGMWLRPLLHCRKQSLIDYLAQRGVPWREDQTNAEEITLRNSLRLRVMPEIERLQPGAVEAIVRFADIQRRESDFLDGFAQKWLRENALQGPWGLRIGLGKRPDAVILARAMKIAAGKEALSTDVGRLCALCEAGSGKLDLRCALRGADAPLEPDGGGDYLACVSAASDGGNYLAEASAASDGGDYREEASAASNGGDYRADASAASNGGYYRADASAEPYDGGFYRAEAGGGEIWLLKKRAPVKNMLICPEGATQLSDLGRLTAREGSGRPVKDDPNCQELDAQACEGALLRLWQEGDRIRPLGMGGRSRLLSDVYAGKGIPPQRRRFLPVLEKDGEIIWAVGACISERAKLTEGCRAVRLRWEPAPERPWKNTKDYGGDDDA